MTDTCVTSNGIDDGVPCLNTPMTHPPMPQDVTLGGAKELATKDNYYQFCTCSCKLETL